MITRPIGTVTLPRAPRKGVDLVLWCQDVNRALQQLRDRPIVMRGGAGSSSGGSASPCSFGSIIAIDDETAYTKGIRGGLIICGDQNFNVEYQGLDTDPATNGVWLVQITLSDIECATDDDGEIFLPGVITSTGTPTWALVAWTDPTDYTPNTNPASPAAPTGTIVIPVGKLTITDGVPSLDNTGCGTATIGQCAGILSYTRG